MMVPPSAQADVYYMLKDGEILGPYSGVELKNAADTGNLNSRDFVQVEGQATWHPLAQFLGEAPDDSSGPIAPDWKALLMWSWMRIRYNLDEQPLRAGGVFLALGVCTMILSRWPVVFWTPWFLAAFVIAIVLLRRQRRDHAFLLLGGVICAPFLFIALTPHAAKHSESGIVREVSTTVASDAPVREPATAALPIEPSRFVPASSADSAVAQPISTQAAATAPTLITSAVPQPELSPVPQPPAVPAVDAPTTSLPSVVQEEEPGFIQRTLQLFSRLTSKPANESSPSQPVATSATPAPKIKKPRETKEVLPDMTWTINSGEFVRDHADAFVLVKGRDGSGSGFVCRVGSQTWLFTNIHVVAGMQQPQFTGMDGTTLTVGAADLAAGHDIMRLAVPKAPAHPLEAMTDFGNNVRIGDEVAVLGNSGGGGVLTHLVGEIVGVGPDRIEVSAQFIPGNSGSPIVHMKTGKVIGVATYLTQRHENFGGSSGNMVVRRFGYRLDSVRTWEPVNWSIFRQEVEQTQQISNLTKDVISFLQAIRYRNTPTFMTETLRRPATQWFSVLNGQRVSVVDKSRATESFLRTLSSIVRSDVTAAEARLRYSYFRDELRSEREIRDQLYKSFDAEARRMASPSERFMMN